MAGGGLRISYERAKITLFPKYVLAPRELFEVGALAPLVSGRVNPGPSSYDFEIWLSSALLAVTFPFLIFFADFFEMWPLKRAAAAVPERAESGRT